MRIVADYISFTASYYTIFIALSQNASSIFLLRGFPDALHVKSLVCAYKRMTCKHMSCYEFSTTTKHALMFRKIIGHTVTRLIDIQTLYSLNFLFFSAHRQLSAPPAELSSTVFSHTELEHIISRWRYIAQELLCEVCCSVDILRGY